MSTKSNSQLHLELEAARKQVVVGGIYSHFKHPDNTYLVMNLAFIEASDELCVIYQAEYDTDLVFVRPLSSWLGTSELNGKKVPRFTLEK